MAKSPEKRQAALGDLCRRAGIQATHQRAEICAELASTEEHPDAETVYRRVRWRIPCISLDTVYRALRVFEGKGLICRAHAAGERGRFDANRDRHCHFLCVRCGLARDFYSKELDRIPVPRMAALPGMVQSLRVELRGLCRECNA